MAWTYLEYRRTRNELEPKKRNVYPPRKTIFWGFDIADHQVKLCLMGERGGQNDILLAETCEDAPGIVAWAPVTPPTAPDTATVKSSGAYLPKVGTVEHWQRLLRYWRSSRRTATKAERTRRQRWIDLAASRITELRSMAKR